MTTTIYNKIGDIYECLLTLDDNTEVKIPMREDGYIFATKLCKVSNKQVTKWRNLTETKKVIKKLEDRMKNMKCDLSLHKDKVITLASILTDESKDKTPKCEIALRELIEIYKGGSAKYQQGTWIHPDLGIHLAQWCSPSFSLQVSNWVRELIFTGNVKIGEEKSEVKINEELKLKLEEAEQKLKEMEEKISKTEDQLILTENEAKLQEKEIKDKTKQLNKIHLEHQSFLQRRQLYKVKQGTCVYLIDTSGFQPNKDGIIGLIEPTIKFGNTGDINNRMAHARTYSPFTKLMFVLFTDSSIEFEKAIKLKYRNFMLLQNHEFIVPDLSFEDIKIGILKLADALSISYTTATDEELSKFNENKESREIFQDIIITTGQKRCGGRFHETEESRSLPITNFFKNSNNKDGVNRLCKSCFEKSTFGDVRKKRKIVSIPSFNVETHKWCNLCESVKERIEFPKAKEKKDGLNANCKNCCSKRKRDYKERIKKEVIK